MDSFLSVKYRCEWVDQDGEEQRSRWFFSPGLANSVRDQIEADNPGSAVDIKILEGAGCNGITSPLSGCR